MLIDRWVYQVPTKSPQSVERANVVQADQAGIARHVHVEHGYQLPPIRLPAGCGRFRHRSAPPTCFLQALKHVLEIIGLEETWPILHVSIERCWRNAHRFVQRLACFVNAAKLA